MSRRLKGISAALIIFYIAGAAGQTSLVKIASIETDKPIAMDKSASELFVLGSSGYVSRFRLDTLAKVKTFRIRGFSEESNFEPVDIVFTEAYGKKSLFVSGNISSTFNSYCAILRFSIEGDFIERIPVQTLCAGMDYDLGSRFLYIASADHKGIYRIGVQKSGVGYPESFGKDPGISRMGPLIVDSSSKRLFVSDVEESGIYEFDIDRRTWRKFQTAEGAIRADSLSLDASGKNLYALNGLARTVSVIPIASGEGNARPRNINLPSTVPTAITTLEMGKLAIADIGSSQIILLGNPEATGRQSAGILSLQLQSISVKHNGAPGSTKWHFEIYVNGRLVATIPEYDFGHVREVSANTPEGVSCPPIPIPHLGTLNIEILGYGPRERIPVRGTKQILLSGAGGTVRVVVKNRPSLFGKFDFIFLVT